MTKNRHAYLPAFILLALVFMIFGFSAAALPTSVQAAASSSSSGAALTTPGSDFEAASSDPLPVKEAPSSTSQDEVVQGFIIFAVSWTIFYIIIKTVRRKFDRNRKL